MTDTPPQPLYAQIADLLTDEIAAGRLREGDRLPPERDMATAYGISVGTLRKALAALSSRGLVESRQGSGNYIRNTRAAGGLYAFFRLERVEGGGQPSAEIIGLERLEKPADLPTFGTSAEAWRIRRLRRLDGDPAAAEEIWLDAGRADDLRAEDLSPSLYHFYHSRLGLRIVRAEDRVGVATMPDWAPPLEAGRPAGYVDRISHAQDGRSVEVSRTWFDPDRARYVSRIR
ncbi:transcriptional regulator, GntR family [Tranquillimonas rosea]|uniref:Transcriptional regulator, GntR family n=1 Tax=Tranquillimonas rosea TaxID=641238 RepID=A0A1H9Q7J5_9RHOB|nr:GntR family transcriptional regulator [Tranquillimonas rosea]SER56115.1 transcriptional regulator, GntR family [Tranquillimonas rosea]